MDIEIVGIDLSRPVSISGGVWAEFKCSVVSGMAVVVPAKGYYQDLDLNLLSGKFLSVETSQEAVSDFRILTHPEKQELSIKALPTYGDYEITGLVNFSHSDGFFDVNVNDLTFSFDIEETQGIQPEEGQWVSFVLHGLSFYDDGNYCWYESNSPVQWQSVLDRYRESQRVQIEPIRIVSFSINNFIPTIKKLYFTLDGTLLFQSIQNNSKVAVWDANAHRLNNICPGQLIGFSDDGKTFLTNQGQIKAWHTLSGEELLLAKIDPDTYPLHQRVVVFTNRDKTRLQIRDAFEIHPPQEVDVPAQPNSFLENWAMVPNTTSIAVIYGGSASGWDWSTGACINLATGKVLFDFDVGRNEFPPSVISFSAEHNLLISGSNHKFWLYDLDGVEPVTEIRLANEHPSNPYHWGGDIVTINPRNRELAAANLGLEYIQIVKIQKAPQGAVERVIQEPTKVIDLEFHPDGVHLASFLRNQEIHIWNIETGELNASLSR